MKIILGINWEQNSSAALLIDGVIVGCSSEERFTNIKNDETYPINAINWLLEEFQITPSQIEKIAFISEYWSPTYSLIKHYTSFSIREYIEEQELVWKPRIYDNEEVSTLKVFESKIVFSQFPGQDFWQKIVSSLESFSDHVSNTKLKELGKSIRSEVVIKHLAIDPSKVIFIDHHLGHAAYGYFASNIPSKNCLVVTLDAFGDFRNYTAHIFTKDIDNNCITVKEVVSGNNFIVGRLYRYITLILNMKPNEHEYKVMGLAPYGKNEYAKEVVQLFESYQTVSDGLFVDVSKPKDMYFQIKEDLVGQRFDAIATGLQTFTENLIAKWIDQLVQLTGVTSIAISGGVAMNVKANSVVSKSKFVESLYIPPSPDDSSQSMGAAYAALIISESEKPSTYIFPGHIQGLSNAYLGKGFSNEELHKIGADFAVRHGFKLKEDGLFHAAELLHKGAIIGRFVGRGEFGARALGNRSILANPKNAGIKKKINEKIKNRDFWMPFAATILEDYADDYLNLDQQKSSYFYMTNACETTPLGAELLQAAIHPYDESCRPQILIEKANPEYWKLITAFGKLSGIYAMLNTSLNFHGKPVVGDPQEALNLFRESNLDGILLGDTLIYK
jgi:carbamoyltransferase